MVYLIILKYTMVESSSKDKITTVKLSKSTKDRIDKLRMYKRETYDEILQNLLSILNICKVNPEAAKRRLSMIDKKTRKAKAPLKIAPLTQNPRFQMQKPIQKPFNRSGLN